MATSDPAAAAQYIAEIQELRTSVTLGIVTAALLLYDVLLTSGREYQYIWQSGKSRVSRALCAALGWFTYVLQILSLTGPGLFTTLRIYALSRRNKIMGGVALVLGMAPFIVNASNAFQKPPINLPAPLNCSSTDMARRSLQIGWVLYIQSYSAICTCAHTSPSDEFMYHRALVSMNVANIVLVVLSVAMPSNDQSSFVLYFVDPISSILNNRFLLALHETNTRLEGEEDTTAVSSLSFYTSSGDDPRAGSPEILEFLSVIGGPIHSFHNDEDLELLSFAPPTSQEEHQSGLDREALESGGDGGGFA
ncbi:hypothetical protein VTO73DRAFT_14509 [Trametes versicolor]